MIGIRRTAFPLGVVLGCCVLVACGDDTVVGVSMSGSGSSGMSSTTDILPGTISADETGVATMNGTGDGTTSDTGLDPDTTGTDTDTGEPVEPGHASGAFVNAGSHEGISPGFHLLFTFGQSTQNQNTMSSPGYRMRGGLVPATQ